MARGTQPTDAELVARCLSGDAAGWDALYRRHNALVVRAAAVLAGGGRRGDDLAEEAAARLWAKLLTGSGLTGYDASRAGMGTFLAWRVRREVRAVVAAEGKPGVDAATVAAPDAGDPTPSAVAEFAATLPAGERAYLLGQLLPATVPAGRMTDAERKTRQRVAGKLRAFAAGA